MKAVKSARNNLMMTAAGKKWLIIREKSLLVVVKIFHNYCRQLMYVEARTIWKHFTVSISAHIHTYIAMEQGCQIFLCTTYQNIQKYTKWP
jgi:hypothetical protein